MSKREKIVYVIGAGFSAGLGFPTIKNLLPELWKRLDKKFKKKLIKIIRFHFPDFQENDTGSFPDIEKLLSMMSANEKFFNSSRPAVGKFTLPDLVEIRRNLLLEIARWFHDLHVDAIEKRPSWLTSLVDKIKGENAKIISFNWDLILDELLFADELNAVCYGMGESSDVQLIKPHGSLNWYEHSTGKSIKEKLRFPLHECTCGYLKKKLADDSDANELVYAFKKYREVISEKRSYMPLIVPPIYTKDFDRPLWKSLLQKTVDVLSVANKVYFLGYSMADADFHARFVLRCGFHNQEDGKLLSNGIRAEPTGKANVTVVDHEKDAFKRITKMVGYDCVYHEKTIEKWVAGWVG